MQKEIVLYHGSEQILPEPRYGGGRPHNDYGPGFYCTEDEGLAKEWGCTSLRGGFANRYRLELSELNILRLNGREYNILNWLAILAEYRQFRVRTPIAGRAKKYLREHFNVSVDNYDVVIGYRADDAYYDFADSFLTSYGCSQQELARRSGVGLRSIQMYEQRNKDINKAQGETLFRLARALGCRMEDLLEA